MSVKSSNLLRTGDLVEPLAAGARAFSAFSISEALRTSTAIPDRRGAELPETLLIVGRDVALLATLKAVLHECGPTEIACGTAQAFAHCDRALPTVCVVDDSMRWTEMLSVVNTVRRNVTQCALAVGFDHELPEARLNELAMTRPDALFTKPYDWNELRKWVQLSVRARERARAMRRLSLPVSRALHYVVQHYREATLADAAKASRVSSGYLAHVFPEELPTTFWRHVTNVRLELTKTLLAQTTHKLEYIAELVGFSDGPHLWRVFHRHFAQNPGHYRRTMTESAA